MPLYPPFWRPFEKNGGHLQRNKSILETKRRRASIVTLCLGFVGRRFQRMYCRIHHAIASTILEAILKTWRQFLVIRISQKLRGVEPSISPPCRAFVEKSIVSYVSVLGINHFEVYGGHFTKWRPCPRIMLFISATSRDVTTILIYFCIFYRVAELRRNYCD